MAKGARSSQRKRNNANLRAKVFGPAHDARTERLSAKLLELANAPKPDQGKSMHVDEQKENEVEALTKPEAQIDGIQWTGIANSSQKLKTSHVKAKSNRIAKRKPKNQIVFPSEMARKKRQAKGRKG